MTASVDLIADLAQQLDEAETSCAAMQRVSELHPQLGVADAYAIQQALWQIKVARGHRSAGLKMGLTSRAKIQQMGVASPIYGFLADYYALDNGASIDTKKLIHPRVEAEIAFVTKTELRGPGCHIGDVLRATDYVTPAIEVIDSRYRNFSFDLVSVIADNCSSCRFTRGNIRHVVEGLDLRTLGVVLEKNGAVVALGAGAAVLGHPAASVAMLANMLSQREECIPAGSFIMTGGITEAIAVQAGDRVTARFQHLGPLSLNFG